jgi:hypothetical protein
VFCCVDLGLLVNHPFLSLHSSATFDPPTMAPSSQYTSPFDRYQNEFRDRIRQIEKRLHDDPSQDVSDLIRQCEEELLPQMRLEARGVSSTDNGALKQDLIDMYKACQMQLESYKALHDNKKELFSKSTQHNRDRVERTSYQVASQNERLTDALKSIRETEELAGEISGELGRNRKTLERAGGRVNELSGLVKQANGHLKSMMRKWF